MTNLDDKGKATENKYGYDNETEFRIRARRDKLLGLWVAGKMGLKKPEAEEYALSLATLDLEKSHHEALLARITKDLNGHSITISEHDIRAQMHHLLKLAREQVVGS